MTTALHNLFPSSFRPSKTGQGPELALLQQYDQAITILRWNEDVPGNWRQEGELSMELFEIDPNMASWNKMGPNHFPRMNVCGFPVPLSTSSPVQHSPPSYCKGKIPKINLINNPDFTKPVREQLLNYIAEEWMVIIEGSETLGKLVCKLMDALFTSNEMATSSVTGKMSSKACGAKKALDPKKTNLIIAFSMQKFPTETPVTVKQKMAQKCKSEGIKRREATLGLRRRLDGVAMAPTMDH